MSEQAFFFDEVSHLYSLSDGRIVPGHTRVLEFGGLVNYQDIAPEIIERKSEIGREVHRASKMYDDGVLIKKIDPRIEGYLDAWIDFRRHSKFTPFLREHRGVYWIDGLPFGMQIDALGMMAGIREEVSVELKTCTQILPHHGVQLAAQAAGVAKNGVQSPLAKFLTRKRIAVQLRADGSFKVHTFEDRSDFEAFRAALFTTHWKMQHRKFYEEISA